MGDAGKEETPRISRRGFLAGIAKGAGAVVAGGALASCAPKKPESTPTQETPAGQIFRQLDQEFVKSNTPLVVVRVFEIVPGLQLAEGSLPIYVRPVPEQDQNGEEWQLGYLKPGKHIIASYEVRVKNTQTGRINLWNAILQPESESINDWDTNIPAWSQERIQQQEEKNRGRAIKVDGSRVLFIPYLKQPTGPNSV